MPFISKPGTAPAVHTPDVAERSRTARPVTPSPSVTENPDLLDTQPPSAAPTHRSVAQRPEPQSMMQRARAVAQRMGIAQARPRSDVAMRVTTDSTGLIDLADLKQSIAAFNATYPKSPERAGTYCLDPLGHPQTFLARLVDGSVYQLTLCYNVAGAVEIRTPHKARTEGLIGDTVPATNLRVPASTIGFIAELHEAIEASYNFSSFSLPLAFCRTWRTRRQIDPQTTAADVLPLFSEHGATLLNMYRGATCMSLAENLRNRIRAEFQLEAHVICRPVNGVNVLTAWPSLIEHDVAVKSQEVRERIGNDEHADVVVHFTDEADCQHVLLLLCVSDREVKSSLLTPAELAAKYPDAAVIGNPAGLAAQALGCPSKLHIKDNEHGYVLGLDLLRGKMYFNTSAADATNLLDCNFISALRQTDKTPVYIDDTVHYLDGREQCELFLHVAQQLFAIPDGFVEDTMFLFDNLDEYMTSVVVKQGQVLRHSVEARDEATLARDSMYKVCNLFANVESVSGNRFQRVLKQLASGDGHVTSAAGYVENGDAQKAVGHYQNAVQKYKLAMAHLKRDNIFDLATKAQLGDVYAVFSSFGDKVAIDWLKRLGATALHRLARLPDYPLAEAALAELKG